MKNIDFCYCNTDDGLKWDIMINQNVVSQQDIKDIEDRLRHAFQLGMEFKAKQIRECLEIKEKVSLS